MDPSERAALREHLLAEGIAGDTRTPRDNVVSNAQKLATGDPDKAFGFDFAGLDLEEVLAAVAALCGCSADTAERTGPGVIDPERTLDELEAAAARLALASERGERVLLATGHPAGLLPLYAGVGRGLTAGGAKLVALRQGDRLGQDPAARRRERVRYLDAVACLTDGASLFHTHESWPMERVLEAPEVPDLVFADHGFAGAAIVRGIETLAIADVNDPALSVAKARRMTDTVIPLDDNLDPDRYVPLVRFLARAAARSRSGPGDGGHLDQSAQK
jgi:hypothetical protein